MQHFAYILKCSDGSFYSGYTTDLERRVEEHNGVGESKTAQAAGARYTRARRPVELIFSKKFESRSEAQKFEASVKKLKRSEKLKLINESGN